jgi:hypothetical protein
MAIQIKDWDEEKVTKDSLTERMLDEIGRLSREDSIDVLKWVLTIRYGRKYALEEIEKYLN